MTPATQAYVKRHGLDTLLGEVTVVDESSPTHAVDPSVTVPYAPQWDDLVRLHRTILDRKVTTVLEFGCGYSTLIMAHALKVNRDRHASYVAANLRRSNAFELHAVDDDDRYIGATRERLVDAGLARAGSVPGASVRWARVRMVMFGGRVATEYDPLPNVCPDFIYLDGPSQHSPHNDIAGITTAHPDRLPMACDILRIEHFLLPGTLVIVDGRTANARFLRANLQREWSYTHDPVADVHTFEQIEAPLGKWNARQIEFSRSGPVEP